MKRTEEGRHILPEGGAALIEGLLIALVVVLYVYLFVGLR